MENSSQRIVLTGFMGVGKSTVARFLSFLLECERIDLDTVIEESEKRKIAAIIETDGLTRFREIETENLRKILQKSDAKIIALGGGAWTIEENRNLIKSHDLTSIWLESNFQHCWRNILLSKRVRPLAQDKKQTRKLFEERQKVYCLADWHFIIRPELTSFEIAKQIAEEVFLIKFN
ncbi:MAG: shikimate kinase [Acidobacteria bacterium]|nr:shikimate kinase [Acidobacteriota bacterium]